MQKLGTLPHRKYFLLPHAIGFVSIKEELLLTPELYALIVELIGLSIFFVTTLWSFYYSSLCYYKIALFPSRIIYVE